MQKKRRLAYRAIQAECEELGVVFEEQLTPEQIYSQISSNIDDLNLKISNNELVMLQDGSLIDANDDGFYVQGGSTFDRTYWWGRSRYKSTYNATRWVGQLNQAGHNFSAVAALSGLFGFVPQSAAGVGGAWYMYTIANKVDTVNSLSSRGIKADIRWWLTYRITSQ